MRLIASLALLLALQACAGREPAPAADATPAADAGRGWPASVDAVILERAPAAPAPLLDVTIEVFDTGLSGTTGAGDKPVFPEVRKAEAFYVPVQLRRAMAASGFWGAVRVAPRPSETAALAVRGKILHADGRDLVLAVHAEDAAGRVWLDRRYRDHARADDYPVAAGEEPFADIYRRIANDLAAARRRQPTDTLPELALLRFAALLAPDPFADYLQQREDGRLALRRLPAGGDPMLARIRRLRRQEYLFLDAADERYGDLVARFAPTYHLWRQYARELALYEEDYLARASARGSDARRGTYAAMQQTYSRFRRVKIQEQDLQELAAGFDNEVTETVLDVDDSVYRLSGSLAEQFAEWRRILDRIVALEMGRR